MKKITTIIGILAIPLSIAGVVAVIAANPPQDYAVDSQIKLEESQRLQEEARVLACMNYGQLMADCFQRKPGACAEMHSAEQDYSLNFSEDPRMECETDATVAEMESEEDATGVAPPSQGKPDCPPGEELVYNDIGPECHPIQKPETIPTKEENPLFFGDEEGGQY